MTDAALPVLTEDGSRLDWPDAAYRPEVRIGGGATRIAHRLEGAPTLERLIAEGAARWAVELRCPRTLLARVETSDDAGHEAAWSAAEAHGAVFVIPGVVAVRPLRLEAPELGALWRGERLDVPAGWWLARGVTRRDSTLRESLLSFEPDADLPPGAMAVDPRWDEGRPRFVVRLAPDIRAAAERDRSLQVAGLIAVCARFHREFTAEAEDEHAIVREIRDRLEEAGVPAWDDEGQWDPARAATAIERFAAGEPDPDPDA